MTLNLPHLVRTLLLVVLVTAGLSTIAAIFAASAHADGREWARPVQLAANHGENSDFGHREAPVPGASTFHKGQDFGAKGTNPPLFAMSDGTVSSVKKNNGGAGNMLTIDLGECSSVYMHMETIDVHEGQTVTRGQQVGTVGSTGIGSGEHLHLGMKCGGSDYIDPVPVLEAHGIDPYDANDNLGGPAAAPAPEPQPAPAPEVAPAPETVPAPEAASAPAPAMTDVPDADKVVSVDALNVRATPDTSRERTDKLGSGTHVTVTATVESQDPYGDGRKTWFQTTGGQFVWSGGLSDAPVAAPAPEPIIAPAAAPHVSSPEEAKAYAAAKVADRGWNYEQFGCLDKLWTKESGWRYNADNPGSSAYGIPQALPGRKMAAMGADWEANPETQVNWGLKYIQDAYGSPCKAWQHSRNHNWY